eukprot:11461477-Ditylum_brightwellii.AAC.1
MEYRTPDVNEAYFAGSILTSLCPGYPVLHTELHVPVLNGESPQDILQRNLNPLDLGSKSP